MVSVKWKFRRAFGAILATALGVTAAVAVVVALPNGTNQAGSKTAGASATDSNAAAPISESSPADVPGPAQSPATTVRVPALSVTALNGATAPATDSTAVPGMTASATDVHADTTAAPGEASEARASKTQASGPQAPTAQAPASTALKPSTTPVNVSVSAAPATQRTKVAPAGTALKTTAANTPTKPAAPQQPAAPGTPKAPIVPVSSPARTTSPVSSKAIAPATAPKPHFTIPVSLGNATQLITVTAKSKSAKSGTLRAWQKGADGSWKVVYGPVTAWVGSAGIGKASETTSHTPLGTFTMTEAFGTLKDPGTALPYRVTGPNDWWVSDTRAASYNTLQTCRAASCPFNTKVSEHLRFITPYYDYAVVMDVNRSPVVKGAGSAFFLHVSVGEPTAGCVAIDKATLVKIMRWLNPAQHPRIATGIG